MEERRRLKIVFAMARGAIRPSGGFRIIAGYADQLAERGHDVTIIAPGRKKKGRKRWKRQVKDFLQIFQPREDLPSRPYLKNPNVKTVILKNRPMLAPEDFPEADVLIATWWETAEWISAVPAKCEKIHFVQGHEVFAYLPLQRVQAVLKSSIRKIVVSRWLQNIMADEYGVDNSILIENVVDVDDFKSNNQKAPAEPTIGFVYSELEEKDSGKAIEACRILKQKIPSLRVISFGGGAPKPKHNMPDWVEYHCRPAETEIPAIYRAASVWLFTSREEGFGLPVLEAMASGVPVVATPAGAAPEIVTDENGALVGHSVDEIADAAERILAKSAADWAAMSTAASATARKRGWKEAADEFEAAILEAGAA